MFILSSIIFIITLLTVMFWLATAPDVMTHLDLLGSKPGHGQQVIEAVHGGVDDVGHLEGKLHLPGQDLVS